jgi:phosphoribosyl-AMP cyclohydrolase
MTEMNLAEKIDWKKMSGLIPVVVQDAKTKEVLKTGKATYWSRSRKELWVKGETSGHTQKIRSVLTDCDYDTLLYIVEQKGPACHTGDYTCFHNDFKCKAE